MPLTIRRATVDDAATLSRLAERTFDETFGHLYPREDLQAFFDDAYTVEKQRVILARALTQQTPCLILDEPTNHLDIKYQLQLMDLVSGLNRTVITAVHDLNIAAMYCDRLYALKDGKIVGQGTPEQLLTPAFIREIYEVDAEVFRDKQGILRILYYPDGGKPEVDSRKRLRF